jgi:Cu/Ag efflux pump CusA
MAGLKDISYRNGEANAEAIIEPRPKSAIELIIEPKETKEVISKLTRGAATVKTIQYVEDLPSQVKTATLIIGDATNVITTGIKGGFECPITGHITAARVESLDATSGAIAIAVWIEPYAGGVPVNADEIDIFSIAASGTQSEETGLTIDVTAGDWISFNVDSVTSMKLIAISLTIEVG